MLLNFNLSVLYAQNFVVQSLPDNASYSNATSAGRGLSLALSAEGSPYLAAYNRNDQILFIEKQNDAWVYSQLTDDVVNGLISLTDVYETSIAVVNANPIVAYYDGNLGNLMLAVNGDDSWTLQTIDDGADLGNDVGAFVDLKVTENGTIRMCYTDLANDRLKFAEGNLVDGFSVGVIDAGGGSWCTFISDSKVLYSKNDSIFRAELVGGNWEIQDTEIAGVQPTGGYNTEGDYEQYSTQVKGNYGNNGVSDTSLNVFYQAAGTSGSSYQGDSGAYPSYIPDVGYANRVLSYSALFGHHSYVEAFLTRSDGVYRYTISMFAESLPEIRHVAMAKSYGKIHVAYSYKVSDQQYINYATLEVEEPPVDNGGDDENNNNDSNNDSNNNNDSNDSVDEPDDNSDNPGEPDTPSDDDSGNDDNSSGDSNISDVLNNLENIKNSIGKWRNIEDTDSLLNSLKESLSSELLNSSDDSVLTLKTKTSKLSQKVQMYDERGVKGWKLKRALKKLQKNISKIISKLTSSNN